MVNMMNKYFVGAIFGLGLALGASIAPAQDEDVMDSMHRFGHGMARMAHHLELTDAQKEEISVIFEEAHAAGAADRERREVLRDELETLMDDYNATQAQAISTELGEIHGRLAYIRIDSRAQINEVLTEEQLEELAEMREQHAERRGKGGKRFGGPDGRGDF